MVVKRNLRRKTHYILGQTKTRFHHPKTQQKASLWFQPKNLQTQIHKLALFIADTYKPHTQSDFELTWNSHSQLLTTITSHDRLGTHEKQPIPPMPSKPGHASDLVEQQCTHPAPFLLRMLLCVKHEMDVSTRFLFFLKGMCRRKMHFCLYVVVSPRVH